MTTPAPDRPLSLAEQARLAAVFRPGPDMVAQWRRLTQLAIDSRPRTNHTHRRTR